MTRIASAVCATALALAAPSSAQVVRLSVSTDGVPANGSTTFVSVSADGRFVAFDSDASNLVADDTNGAPDVFLRDRDTDADGVLDEPGAVSTTRLSLAPGGAQSNGLSFRPRLTPDGRYVFFLSTATNLLPGASMDGDLYRLDRHTGTLIRAFPNVSVVTTYDISADGNIVVVGLAVRDVAAGITTTLPPPYVVQHDWPYASLIYGAPSLSADGSRIAYWVAIWIVRGVPVENPQVYVYDRASSAWSLVPVTEPGAPFLGASGATTVVATATHAALFTLATGAERRVPFAYAFTVSPDQRLMLGGTGALYDDELGVTSPLGFEPGAAAFSADDRWLIAATLADLPGAADTNGRVDVFAIDLPAFFDADADTMDDRWEAIFGVTDPGADPDGDGQTNAQEENAGTHPNGVVSRFLAEGATGTFFRTQIALANPSASANATAVLTFDTGDGTRVRRPIAVPAGRSAVVDVGAVSGLAVADVSTTIESDRLLGIQRTMFWGASPTVPPYGSHAETAAPAPSPTWVLAEGSTVLDFDLFYLLQNPQPTTTHATVRFLLPSGTTITKPYDLPPGSRTTIYVNEVAGLEETDVSGDISADAPIVVERAMYRSAPGQPFALGSDSMGVTAPATTWFFAEGATGSFFDLYILIANPGNTDAVVRADYLRPDGSVVTQTYTVRALSRHSVYVDSIPGLDATSVATTLTSTNGAPIVAERAMYWPGGFFEYYEGHSSAGSTTTALEWVVAGGQAPGLPDDAQTYVLIANTESRAGEATLDILFDRADTGPFPAGPLVVPLPPHSRTTVPITGAIRPFGVRVRSTGASPVQLVVESAHYRSGSATWATGANALATPVP